MRIVALLLAIAAAGAIACGASNQSTHDGTTVTVQQPSGSAAPPPVPSK